ncbi:signal peptidase I [Desulfitibacter alkalitolerans]|uniref:signal peptidase I n=1 Tax=Desulfitibacter alkalitolerans TaxID=264641 RepID=UPI000480ECCF|nr:signal peptidase I [Desulfitibacter alkalitolerans]
MEDKSSITQIAEENDLIKNEDVNNEDKKPKKLWKSIFNIIGNTIFVISLILIGFLVFSMVQSKISGGPPTIAGHQMYIVAGGSMSPSFEAGSLSIVEMVEPINLGVGDIITYRDNNNVGITTHRVMEIHNESGSLSFTTRGDANDVNDPHPVLAENIIGRVSFTIPYIGLLMNFGQSKTGLLTLVIIPGILLIIFELRNLMKYAAQAEKEKTSKKAQNTLTSKDT